MLCTHLQFNISHAFQQHLLAQTLEAQLRPAIACMNANR